MILKPWDDFRRNQDDFEVPPPDTRTSVRARARTHDHRHAKRCAKHATTEPLVQLEHKDDSLCTMSIREYQNLPGQILVRLRTSLVL